MAEVLFLNIQGRTVEKTEGQFVGQWALPTPWEDMKTTGTMHPQPELMFPDEYPIDKSTIYPDMYFSVFADQPVEV
jgi:nuclear cap-binding protein subunit 1